MQQIFPRTTDNWFRATALDALVLESLTMFGLGWPEALFVGSRGDFWSEPDWVRKAKRI